MAGRVEEGLLMKSTKWHERAEAFSKMSIRQV